MWRRGAGFPLRTGGIAMQERPASYPSGDEKGASGTFLRRTRLD